MRGKTNIIGTNQTTPGAASAPSNLLTDDTSTTGLVLKTGSGAPATQNTLEVRSSDDTLICETTQSNGVRFYNMKVGAAFGVFVDAACLNGQQDPPCLELPDGVLAGLRVWSGTGTPSSTTVGDARVGDWYLRRDTPSTSNQRLYVCTVAGSPGTWTASAY
jgi:hypothetical protein